MDFVRASWVGVAILLVLAGCKSDGVSPSDAGLDAAEVSDADVSADSAADGGDTDSGSDLIRWRHISTGNVHACGVTDDYRITCWGGWRRFAEGQIPFGTYEMVSASARWDCALDSAGTVDCWGDTNFQGRLKPPVDEEGEPLGGFTYIDIGENHACAAGGPHEIKCWGLGSEEGEREGFSDYDQAVVPEGIAFERVAAGFLHTCAIRADDGAIECWGAGTNPEREVDDNDYDQAVPPEGEYVDIDAARYRNCAVNSDGAIRCWGRDGFGPPPEATNFESITVGKTHACALDDAGEITCWGQDANGAKDVGDGPWEQVAAGTEFTCALAPPENMATGGTVRCWGRNDNDQTEVPE